MNKIVLLFILVFFSINLSAQKVDMVCGEYTYMAANNMTPDDAKRIAVERARNQALADKYGTIVSQNNSTIIKNTQIGENAITESNFVSFGGSEVKGEWIETLSETFEPIEHSKDMYKVSVKVCGYARPIEKTSIQLAVSVLCNNPNDMHERLDFHNGDALYISFRAPIDGYVNVYLVDENDMAYCLLPGMESNMPYKKVDGGETYVFFSPEKRKKNEDVSSVVEYELTTERSMESNQLYIVFSPNEFVCANKLNNSTTNIGELSLKDFQSWLAKMKRTDKDFVSVTKVVSIVK